MAEEVKDTNVDNETEEVIESTDASKNTEDNRIPYERFKQKVDEANKLKEKLAEIERQQEESKRKELEQQEEWKKLYEKAQQEVSEMREAAIAAKKTALLAKAGYTEEQVGVLVNTVQGEDDEEIAKSIEDLTKIISPQRGYVDPSAMGGQKQKPKTKDGESLGRALYERVVKKQ